MRSPHDQRVDQGYCISMATAHCLKITAYGNDNSISPYLKATLYAGDITLSATCENNGEMFTKIIMELIDLLFGYYL